MKKTIWLSFLTVVIAAMPLCLWAQNDTASVDSTIVYKMIPLNMKIKDKIFIQNKSPFYILQVVVALVNVDGEMLPLGSASYIAPNETVQLAGFTDEKLKKLRGQKIAIKTKATKILIADSNTKIKSNYGEAGVRHKELSQDILNSLKPSDITYDYDAKLSEAEHDLYIELYNNGKGGIMDF